MQRGFGEARAMECSICLQEFLEPRILPCGHTFCARCLQQLIGELGPIHALFRQRFRCHQCSKSLAVPSMGVEGFPIDVLMIDAMVNSRAMQILSKSTSERKATTPQRPNQPKVNNAWGGYKHVIAILVIAFIFYFRFNGGSQKKVFSLSQKFKHLWNFVPESGNYTMSLIDNELVIFNLDTSEVWIRERATLEFKSSLTVSHVYSIAGKSFCKKNNNIYVSTTRKEIVKLDSDGDFVAKWLTGDIKGRPSLMVDCNIAFIPHDGTTRIFIYNPIGDLIHIIQLKMNIGGARLNCAVQLRNGHFVVCYGTDQDKQHGVSLIDSDGNVLRSFGGEKGADTNQVNGPYDLIVEENGNVFVVDHHNHRILRLNSDLEYLSEFLSTKSKFRFPYRAIFDEIYGRLFVTGSAWNYTISDFSPGSILVFEIQ